MDETEVQASITLAIVSFIAGILFNGMMPFSSYVSVLSLLLFISNIYL